MQRSPIGETILSTFRSFSLPDIAGLKIYMSSAPLFNEFGMPFDKCLPLYAAQIDPPVADDCSECPIHSNRFPYPTCRNAVLIGCGLN